AREARVGKTRARAARARDDLHRVGDAVDTHGTGTAAARSVGETGIPRAPAPHAAVGLARARVPVADGDFGDAVEPRDDRRHGRGAGEHGTHLAPTPRAPARDRAVHAERAAVRGAHGDLLHAAETGDLARPTRAERHARRRVRRVLVACQRRFAEAEPAADV